jgi:alpha-amylase
MDMGIFLGQPWGFVADGDALVFVDNHYTQRGGGPGGHVILTYKESKLYKVRHL